MTSERDATHQPRSAAFFDVDGTIVKTTIAHYYAYFRYRCLPFPVVPIWLAGYIVKCGYYSILDKINRSRMNVIFYRSYRGMPTETVKALSADCFRKVMDPRRFRESVACVDRHREAGRAIVLVTGSIDFIIKPLAECIGADHVLAPSLIEADGKFTGELDGPPIGDEEKAARIREFARTHDVDLSSSYGYGDSIADLPMLESVGFPIAVNPDKALALTAHQRGWPALQWTTTPARERNGR